MNLTSPAVIKTLMEESGFSFKKKFGQNFLINKDIPKKIAQASISNTTSPTACIEIGPGVGVMTEQLSELYDKVVAFEIDQEQRKIINECYDKTKKIITENKDLLDLIANTLLEYETITKEQIEYLVKHGCMPDEDGEIDQTDYKEASLKDLTLEELKDLAKEKNIKNISKKTKEELIKELEETE